MFFIFNQISSKDLYKIFWNNYLIETSNFDRSRNLSNKSYLSYLIKVSVRFIIKDLICLISLFSFILSYFFNKKIKFQGKDIFLFTHNSQLKNIPKFYIKYRVNLYPFISIEKSSKHIFVFLNLKEVLYSTIFSFINSPNVYLGIYNICKKEKINFIKYIFFNSLNLTRILELNLLYLCLKKINKSITISTASQFCPFLQLLSIYKISNKNNSWYLHLFQHGVYELDRFQRSYSKIYLDELSYKFNESVKWVTENYIFNKNFILKKLHYENTINSYFKSNKKNKIIAYASSGFYERDHLILQKLDSLRKQNNILEIIFYPHPALRFDDIRNQFKRYKNLIIEFKERYKNIDLLITGYSSIGLEHLNLDIKVLFIPFDDSICAFQDKYVEVLRDNNHITDKVKKILNI
tara:strand:+ start:3032 stop:4252 length:1221 start_codon:yes stop_codon:yes gene_type:complete